jgi:hypothetical protein
VVLVVIHAQAAPKRCARVVREWCPGERNARTDVIAIAHDTRQPAIDFDEAVQRREGAIDIVPHAKV